MKVEIRIRDKGTFAYLDGISKRTKKVGETEIGYFAKFGAQALKHSALRAGITEWKGKMIKPIEAKKLSSRRWGIYIPQIIKRLDELPDHYVSLKKGRLITLWAQERFGTKTLTGLSRVSYTKRGKIRGAIYVTQHPFIESGFNSMVKRATMVANRIANKSIRGR